MGGYLSDLRDVAALLAFLGVVMMEMVMLERMLKSRSSGLAKLQEQEKKQETVARQERTQVGAIEE